MKVFIYSQVEGNFIWTRTLHNIEYIKINGNVTTFYTSDDEYKFNNNEYRFEVEVEHGS
jgi:hypothetical protein